MSKLVGVGNALTNMGTSFANSLLARQDRLRQEQQQEFQNRLAQDELDLRKNEMARAEAARRQAEIFKILGSLPQEQTIASPEQAQRLLKGAPDLEGLFINKQPGLTSRPITGNLTQQDAIDYSNAEMPAGGSILDTQGSIGAGAPTTGPQSGNYILTRPESDPMRRAELNATVRMREQDIRRDLGIRRLQTSDAANRIRMQIAQMRDETQRTLASNALAAAMQRHAGSMALRGDANDLDWAQAEADLELEWQKIMANSIFAPNPLDKPKLPPRTPRGKKPAGSPAAQPAAGGDIIDEVLRDMGIQ